MNRLPFAQVTYIRIRRPAPENVVRSKSVDIGGRLLLDKLNRRLHQLETDPRHDGSADPIMAEGASKEDVPLLSPQDSPSSAAAAVQSPEGQETPRLIINHSLAVAAGNREVSFSGPPSRLGGGRFVLLPPLCSAAHR